MNFEDCPRIIRNTVSYNSSPTLIMMIGLQGSGKTTLAYEIKDCIESTTFKKVYICSSDNMRKELFGDENVQDKNNEVFKELHKRIKSFLNNNNIVIYDATNVNKKKRTAFLKEVSYIKNLKKICICTAVSIEDCQEQLSLRKYSVYVPYDVLLRTYKSWQPPHHSEGWNIIYTVHRRDYERYITALISKSYSFDQHNCHHNLTLGKHLLETGMNILTYAEQLNSTRLINAACMHDIGKLHAVNYTDKDTNCHYYGHENVSAYLYMLSDKDKDIYGANLIFWHMLPYNPNAEKKLEQIKRDYGEDFYNDLMLLHEADVAAH